MHEHNRCSSTLHRMKNRQPVTVSSASQGAKRGGTSCGKCVCEANVACNGSVCLKPAVRLRELLGRNVFKWCLARTTEWIYSTVTSWAVGESFGRRYSNRTMVQGTRTPRKKTPRKKRTPLKKNTKKLKEENQKKPTGQMAKPDNQPVPRQPDGTQTINQSK